MHRERGILAYMLICLIFPLYASIDTITLTRPLKDGDILVSNGEIFALGFFSPANSTDRYVGIWYNKVSELTVVWVANRDRPINNSSGILSIDQTGNLVLNDKDQSFVFWSTNISGVVNDAFSAKLLDTGNLVLFQSLNKEVYSWQSFDHPSNTFLPSMKLGLDKKTGLNRAVTSWKSGGNPGVGDYTYKMKFVGSPQLFLSRGLTRIWRAGSWTGQGWSGVPGMTSDYIFKNATYVNNNDEVTVVYYVRNSSIFTRLVITEYGTAERLTWNEADGKWFGFWSAPKDQCDGYNHCGPFGFCDPYASIGFECDCLPGYEPLSPEEWYIKDGSKGCKRKVGTQICKTGEGFVELIHVKVPDTSTAFVNMSLGLKACEEVCLKNCTCIGYALADISKDAGEGGCITWYGDMIDTRKFSDRGQSFYVRVDAAELAKYSSKRPIKRIKT